ncbi:MAG: hypothetical protein P8188_08320 [Gemmatimonadota bacterium]
MPSDAMGLEATILKPVLERLSPALDAFRSAVAEAAEEVRVYRGRHEDAASDPADRLARELGPFAKGRIDPARLAALVGNGDLPDPLTDRLMALAHDLFVAAGTGGAGSFVVSVPEGADLRDAVKDALGELGRAFGMAHAVEKARDPRYYPDRDHALLHAHPFHRWTPAERALAPPLVVEVGGTGLRGAGLLEFMEGSQKMVLLVRGDAPPAPLARLASPGVWVAQAVGEAGLDRAAELAAHPGPGILGLVREGSGALTFAYPGEGAVELDAAELDAALEEAARSAGQPGLPDLRWLQAMRSAAGGAAAPAGSAPSEAAVVTASAPTPAPAPSSDDADGAVEASADQLAAWLLAQTDLPEG